jgi:hypothetical protein
MLQHLWGHLVDERQSNSGSDSDSSSSISELTSLRRNRQTQKARFAAVQAKQKKKDDKRIQLQKSPEEQGKSQRLQALLFTHKFYDCEKLEHRNTSQHRGLYSYFAAMTAAITSVFTGPPDSHGPLHVISVCTVDDTNIRMGETSGSSTVYTVMNVIQNVFARFRGPGAETKFFRIHTPMMTLPSATAASMHAAATSWFLLSARGIGHKLSGVGLAPSVLHRARYTATAWVTDALKANGTVVSTERKVISKTTTMPQTPKHLQFHLECGIHGLALIRRPLVLLPPGYWATLVRLGHLMESRSWRNKLREALTFTVLTSFKRYVVDSLPEESVKWRNKIAVMLQCWGPAMRKYQREARAIFQRMCNGDPSSKLIIHWCVRGVCTCVSDDAAMTETLRGILGLFGRGYATPLLSRWKHYSPASQYVNQGRFLFELLPRALDQMSRNLAPDNCAELNAMIKNLLASASNGAGFDNDDSDVDDVAAEAVNQAQRTIEELLDADVSYADNNKKRARLVREVMLKDDFGDHAATVHLLCGPPEYGINHMMARTQLMEQLRSGLPGDFPSASRATNISFHVALSCFPLVCVSASCFATSRCKLFVARSHVFLN